MDVVTHVTVARELLEARRTGKPIPPLSETHPEMTVADAYAIQLEQVRAWTAAGRTIQGHKVGLTSAAMRRQLGVDQPDYGHLTDDMFHLEALPIDLERFVSPRIEPEIAFVLKRPLAGPGVNAAQALSAIDYVLPALEIIDSRIADWKIGLVDTIADNASAAGVVLGSKPTRIEGIDLRLAGCLLTHNGEAAGTGAGGAILGSPLNALVWLANTLGALGVSLEAEQVVLPGSITSAIPVAAGSVVTATFAELGSVTARFAQETR